MSAEILFHERKGLPRWFRRPTGRVEVTYTRHAAERGAERGVRLPRSVTLDRFRVIEVGVRGRRISKILVRGQLDDRQDLCLVLVPGEWVAKTIWCQSRWDDHRTLDLSRYAEPDAA